MTLSQVQLALKLFVVFFISTKSFSQSFVYKPISVSFSYQDTKLNTTDSFIEATEFISKNNTAKSNTLILQNLLNTYSSVQLPNYQIIISQEGLTLNSNNTLIFQENSKLEIEGNALKEYELLRVHNVQNVNIINPILLGDRNKHKSTIGEQGHGISIRNSTNVRVYNYQIKDFWGDGIFIGRLNNVGCDSVYLINGRLDNNRRNGLSIVSGSNIVVEDLLVSNTNGTLPMYGIDIEPHYNIDKINNLIFKNIKSFNNQEGGFRIQLGKLAFSDKKEVNISLNKYEDIYSKVGLDIARIESELDQIFGSILINDVLLKNNETPVVVKDNQNDKLKIELSNFLIENSKRVSFDLKELIRVINARKNIEYIH